MTIGVIGQGYVGTAIKLGFEEHYNVLTYDKFDLAKSTHSKISDIVEETKVIFVCVPTPMRKDGTCYTGIVEEVIREINETANDHIVVIKSTVPPGTTDRINKEYTHSTIIFNPEFLTEANFLDDFKNQKRIILGGDRKGTNKLRQIYSKVFPHATIVKTGSKTAEMVKYFTNCFLATKVSFANEIYQLCNKLNIDYDKVVEYATLDERLGKSHWGVPGHDGDLGYGGHCFPKDLAALLYLSYQYNTVNGVLKATQETNDKVRSDRDWERMKGRAVS